MAVEEEEEEPADGEISHGQQPLGPMGRDARGQAAAEKLRHGEKWNNCLRKVDGYGILAYHRKK